MQNSSYFRLEDKTSSEALWIRVQDNYLLIFIKCVYKGIEEDLGFILLFADLSFYFLQINRVASTNSS